MLSTEPLVQEEIRKEPTTATIDLRSDTVTRPTAAMRDAMAAAEVGDDVYGEDPTVNKLEAAAAEIFGREAAIFVPTGTMGNQVAIRMHTQHGQEVICETRSHIVNWELAMASAFSGCQLRTISGVRGILTWKDIETAIAPKNYHRAQTGLITIENTHNMAGGTITPASVIQEIVTGAANARLPVHMDGARIFNAACKLNTSVAELTRGVDSVMFCLSKALCAPVGSMLVSSRANIEKARIFRKALGGGMRQAGVLAAAGLIALTEMPKRLSQDHDNARFLAGALSILPQVDLDEASVDTNIVIFRLRGNGDALALVAALGRRNILAGTVTAHSIRLVTHRDVSRADCERAAAILAEEIGRL
jgi:threonine aldolase